MYREQYLRKWKNEKLDDERARRRSARIDFALLVFGLLFLATMCQCAVRTPAAELERKLQDGGIAWTK